MSVAVIEGVVAHCGVFGTGHCAEVLSGRGVLSERGIPWSFAWAVFWNGEPVETAEGVRVGGQALGIGIMISHNGIEGNGGHQGCSGGDSGFLDVVVHGEEVVHVLDGTAAGVDDVAEGDEKVGAGLCDAKSDAECFGFIAGHVSDGDESRGVSGSGFRFGGSFADGLSAVGENLPADFGVEGQVWQDGAVAEVMLFAFNECGEGIGYRFFELVEGGCGGWKGCSGGGVGWGGRG